jgi:flagellar basal-body rod modification protein FlgD
MTSVSATTSTPPAQARTVSDASKSNIDYNAFLQLFIASMKNQDPTKPNDPSQTLSQLASFSNVEQSIKFNEKLDRLVDSSSASLGAVMIGKSLSNLDGSVSGIVTTVENVASGLIARLESGGSIDLSDGYKITSP